MPTETNIISKSHGWAQFIVKWVIAAVAAILIAVGLVSLAKTMYKSSLPKYPIESFKYVETRPQTVIESGKESSTRELTEAEKRQQQEREDEQRALQKINDYALALGQLLAGIGLAMVFWLIQRSKE